MKIDLIIMYDIRERRIPRNRNIAIDKFINNVMIWVRNMQSAIINILINILHSIKS